MKLLDSFTVTNINGTNGVAKVSTGLVYDLAPIRNKDYTKSNPETLLAASLSTCLNATLMSVLKLNNFTNQSTVQVVVDLYSNKELGKLVFKVKVYLAIEGFDLLQTEKYMEIADAKCPVSNLLNKENVSFFAVNYGEF